jgi:hypothetical protein
MKEKVKNLAVDAEKNVQRLDMLKTLNPIEEKTDQSFRYKPLLAEKLTPIEALYIDENFPNPASSRATNRLPLPTEDDFSSSKYRGRSSVIPITDDSQLPHSDFLLQMYKHVDRSLGRQVTRKSVFQEETIQVHWLVKGTGGNRPESREGASVCMIDRKLYLFGGQSMTKRNDVRILNTDNWTWSMLSTQYPPKGRIGHSLVACKNQLILFGGWSHYSQRLRMRRCFKKVYTLFLDQEVKWQRFRGEGKVPKSRRYHCAAVLGSSMVVYGGVDTHSKVLKGLSILEIESLTWRRPSMISEDTPGPRSNCTLTPVFHSNLLTRSDFSMFAIPKQRMDQIQPNSGLYLFGGLDKESRPCGDLWVLTVHDQSLMWKRVVITGLQPIARSDHSAVFLNGYLAIFGGRNDVLYPSYGDSCTGDVSMLNMETLQWDSLRMFGQTPEGRWGHCAAAYSTRMLIFGGINTKQFLPADVYQMETDQKFVSEYIRQDAERELAKEKRNARRGSIRK